MPHVIVEYTDNLEPEADIPRLLKVIADHCATSKGELQLAGVRVRAIRLTDYVIADGKPEYAFVNVTVKMGSGREPAFKKSFFGAMFDKVGEHFADIYAKRPLALSLYIEEIDEAGAFRRNGVREALNIPQKL